jgi:hypothetical protein
MKHTLPPGTYFIGDPGNVLEQSWDSILVSTNFFSEPDPIQIQGRSIWGHRTLNGNGRFTDQNGIEYKVADQVLGAVNIELIENPEGETLGTVLIAPNGLDVEFLNGVFTFNSIVIDSNDPAETDFGDIDGGYDLDLNGDTFL